MSIVEAAFVFALTVAAGAALLLAVWMLAARKRKEVYIAPFQVAGNDADAAIGIALANMLRARLVQAQREAELRQVLSRGGEEDPAATLAAPLATATAAQVRGAVEPVDIDFLVGKVSVGGLFAWAQRWALERRTLRLTVVFRNGSATVSGTLEPFGVTRARGLWSTTSAEPEAIVAGAGDAILQSLAAEGDCDGTQAATALAPAEFRDLLWCLNQLALHERRTRFGQSPTQGAVAMDALGERLSRLVERFPDWADLTRLAENVAQRLAYEPPAEPLPEEQPVEFLAEVRRILARLFPDGDHPEIVIGDDMTEGLRSIWNNETRRYEVNPAYLAEPGFAPEVALMGRLMMKNFGRCPENFADVTLWNDYRHGVVAYIAEADAELEKGRVEPMRQGRFFGWLKRLAARDDVPAGGREGACPASA